MIENKRAKTLPSGRTAYQELLHKVRGWLQFWSDVGHLYPNRVICSFVVAGALIIAGAWWRHHATENRRLLVGEQAHLGHLTFAAIKAADDLSEDFTNVSARRKAFAEAATQLSNFQQYARTAEELHAGTVLAYYFDEVRQLPERDLECALAMQSAQQAGQKTADGSMTRDQVAIAEVGELTCMSARSQAVANKNVCRDEALSNS